MAANETQYPSYSRAEIVADGLVHALGLAASLIAIGMFLAFRWDHLSSGQLAALSIYWLGLIAMFTVSGAYHMTPWERFRARLRRADHATIFLKIAGTYTPFVVTIGTGFGYIVLAIVWALALFGAITKLFRWSAPGRWNAALYVGLGWISVALMWSVFETSPAAGGFAAAGGILYTAGILFFKWESLRFSNAIWHGFVVAASGCFFAAVSLAVSA
ncbi:PAQR family membrane homeostasis protein TrhA [Litoreibacter janthinus]|uniref:Hemolysin III n=1 Tax=Litoreibacter janthinus TaxID=670154 RepID=A0A1I6HFG0_9RHOB|nr:hemolysin III family protein [Litoreibacter janthinus]SFR53245.1 hemolysin III [Litoreibacter janthinus]